VTGAAGFIGFHTALALKARGDFVIGCDLFNDYYDPNLKKARAELLHQQGIEVQKVDICHPLAIESLLASHEITHVLHLAAQAGVRHSMEHPECYVHSNLNGFIHILEALKRFPGVKLIYASSSSVYGTNSKIPFAETDPTDHPASFYGATKKSNEIAAASYHHIYGIPCTGLRYFTVYGPWGRPDMAYFSFTRAILQGTPIPVYGEGKLERDFTFIDDIVAGTIAAIDLGAPLDIFNLGNCRPQSVSELIQQLEMLLEKKAHIEFQPMPRGDVPITYADISKSQKILNFEPKTTLKEGLSHFIDWYLSHYVSAKTSASLQEQR
jgi:UDP-glucuronate 4-epimerase